MKTVPKQPSKEALLIINTPAYGRQSRRDAAVCQEIERGEQRSSNGQPCVLVFGQMAHQEQAGDRIDPLNHNLQTRDLAGQRSPSAQSGESGRENHHFVLD